MNADPEENTKVESFLKCIEQAWRIHRCNEIKELLDRGVISEQQSDHITAVLKNAPFHDAYTSYGQFVTTMGNIHQSSPSQ